ncbi:hypothetical protein [Nocardia fluminea]
MLALVARGWTDAEIAKWAYDTSRVRADQRLHRASPLLFGG